MYKKGQFNKQDLSPRAFSLAGMYRRKATLSQRDIVKKLYRRVQNRIINIRKHPELSQIAVKRYETKVLSNVSNIDTMSKTELTNLFAELTYIDRLKSSYMNGAVKIDKLAEDLLGKETYNKLDNKHRNAVFELFHKMQEADPTNAKGSKGSPILLQQVRVAYEQRNIRFRNIRDKKTGRFTSEIEAYLVDDKGRPVEYRDFKNIPIDVNKVQEYKDEYDKKKNKRLIQRGRKLNKERGIDVNNTLFKYFQ